MFMPASGSSTCRSVSRTASSSGINGQTMLFRLSPCKLECRGAQANLPALGEPTHEWQSLRRSESDVIEETEQREVAWGHYGFHTLDAQRAEIDEQLRQQRVAHAAMRISGIDPDSVDDGHRLGATEVAQVDAGHQKSDDGAVDARGQRDADCRSMHCLV